MSHRPRLAALMMHGEVKLRAEGLRTRDAHLLEWIAHLEPGLDIDVMSRPEPWPRVAAARLPTRQRPSLPSTWNLCSPQPLTLPPLRHTRDWWVTSCRFMEPWSRVDAAIVWNPIAGAYALGRWPRPGTLVLDLLDDWVAHDAFSRIRPQLVTAYGRLFSEATAVTANSEATLALAHRFGRSDAQLIPNGCDPDRFANLSPLGTGTTTIGYGGKIGFRLDLELIEATAQAFPDVAFEFAGPVLNRKHGRALRRIPNVRLLGDVHYEEYPEVMRGWDLAWAPHRLGKHEVGGDLIKLYEYRAAGLPTLTTKVIGWNRAPSGVHAIEPAETIPVLDRIITNAGGPRIAREPYDTPGENTWKVKARRLLRLLSLTDA